MGFAVAAAAAGMGADVTLIAGPVRLCTPPGVHRVDVRSAAQMHAAVFEHLPGQDIFIASAAVADYRPAAIAEQKIKKHDGDLSLTLVRTRDILADVAAQAPRPFVIGFAAETDNVEGYARGKLERKRLDMIAANRVGTDGCGFDSEDNALSVYWPGGGAEIPRAAKSRIAEQLLGVALQRMVDR
jgi:phosphopantothenoylcysteine decarboxylase/phosphopantothenate--cysteine ligase